MFRNLRTRRYFVLLSTLTVAGSWQPNNARASPAAVSATITVRDTDLPDPLVIVAVGDTAFNESGDGSSSPGIRQAMAKQIAGEHPAAIFLNGDLPRAGSSADYAVYRAETTEWREKHIRIYPGLGDQEFANCVEAQCLALWWKQFPELRGRRWYSVALGTRILAVVLDSDASLLPGSEQREWLQKQISSLATQVRYVLIFVHHPPVADVPANGSAEFKPRPNEEALAEYVQSVAHGARAQFLVIGAHIRNYQRFNREGVIYLVSGGGGATAQGIERTEPDLYGLPDPENYHYVRFVLNSKRLLGEMIRLADSSAATPGQWETRDRFRLMASP